MSLDSILWDINQYSIKNISKNNVYGGIKHNYIIEGIKILPLFFFTKFLINYLFEPLIYTLKGLENNVSFLDIDCDNCNEIKLYCDWCSLCNGIIETAKENIIKNPDLIKTINFNKLNICVLYTDFILIHRKHKITNKDVENYCIKTFGNITTNLLTISKLYLNIEQIELRWCPFKRSKEFYYRNTDKRFFTPNQENIYKIREILSNNETITCNNCPNIINNNWTYKKSKEPSIFEPLLDYMILNINNLQQYKINKIKTKKSTFTFIFIIILTILFIAIIMKKLKMSI